MDLALEERQFNSRLKDIMIYVSHVDVKTRDLTDVFIEDRTVKGMTRISIAPKGCLIRSTDSNDSNLYTIRLYDGMINQVDIDKKPCLISGLGIMISISIWPVFSGQPVQVFKRPG